MAQRQSELPENIQARQLGGMDQRSSPANLELGSFSWLEGLYPAQSGLLERIPGTSLLAMATGGVRQIHATYNATQDVIFQTATGRYVYTLNELRNRVVSPSLIFPPINEEETMSYAIIVQQEANAVGGGSARGFISGADSGSTTHTFYGRRLTSKLVDDNTIVTTFTASTGGSNTTSTPGTFALAAGTYRVTAWAKYAPTTTGAIVVMGLYNVTDSQFQSYAGTTVPILSNPAGNPSGVSSNEMLSCIEAEIIITGTKTFQLSHSAGSSIITSLNFGGIPVTDTTANVNGAAALNLYAMIRILKVA